MAIMRTLKSAKAGLVLNGGTDPSTGSTIKKSLALGNVKESATDQEIYNVGEALAPCLAYPTLEVNRTNSYALEME